MTDRSKEKFQDDGGAAQLQAQVDEDNAKGFHGTSADPTPNEAYTVQGSVALNSPEADPDLDAQGNANGEDHTAEPENTGEAK